MAGRMTGRTDRSRRFPVRGTGLGLALALLAMLAAAPASAADMSYTEWDVVVRSKVAVRGVGHDVRYGKDVVVFLPSAEETDRPRGTFEFETMPVEGGWIALRGRYFTGRIDPSEIGALLVERVNEQLGVDDAELVSLRATRVRGAVGRERDRMRMSVSIRARVAVPSQEIEGRLVLIKLRVKGELVAGDPGTGEKS